MPLDGFIFFFYYLIRPTDLSVEYFFLSVANWFDDLQEGLEESEVTQSAGLVVELLPLCLLRGTRAAGQTGSSYIK